MIIDDLEKRAASGNELAKQLVTEWVYPVEMMFLSPAGKLISKLNSYKDFPGMHPDVAAPPDKRHWARGDDHSPSDRFLKHIALHFDKQ